MYDFSLELTDITGHVSGKTLVNKSIGEYNIRAVRTATTDYYNT